MASQAQVFPEFVVQVRKYVLINSDTQPIVQKAGGITIIVPARDQVIAVDPQNPGGFTSALDVDGSYIPGTLAITDRYVTNQEGNDEIIRDAALIVRHLLGINNKQGMATGILPARGLSLLPAAMPRQGLEEIREAGAKRSERWRVQQARFIVSEFDNSNKKRSRHSQPELTPDEDYTQALLLLRAVRGKDQQRLAAMLSGPDVTGDARLMEDIRQDVEADETDEILQMLKDKARQVLPADAPEADMAKLVNMIVNSEEGMKLLRKQFKLKKHAKRKKAEAGSTTPEQITDQEELEKLHGRPKPVQVEKVEANLSKEDKDALLEDARKASEKGSLLEITGDPSEG